MKILNIAVILALVALMFASISCSNIDDPERRTSNDGRSDSEVLKVTKQVVEALNDCDTFINTTKSNHKFAIEYCARLLRFTVNHHGPIKRKEINKWLRQDAIVEFENFLLVLHHRRILWQLISTSFILFPESRPTPLKTATVSAVSALIKERQRPPNSSANSSTERPILAPKSTIGVTNMNKIISIALVAGVFLVSECEAKISGVCRFDTHTQVANRQLDRFAARQDPRLSCEQRS